MKLMFKKFIKRKEITEPELIEPQILEPAQEVQEVQVQSNEQIELPQEQEIDYYSEGNRLYQEILSKLNSLEVAS